MSARGGAVRVIVNPAAGRGRGAGMVSRIRHAFGAYGVIDIDITSAAGEERMLARRAIDQGCTTLVAVGGDGTWSQVANAILESRADCRLALLAAGTGNDFAKTVGAPATDLVTTAGLAMHGPDIRVDVGQVEGRHFLNIAGFGFDIAVLEDCSRLTWVSGPALYPVSALRQLFAYGGVEIEVSSLRNHRDFARHLMLIIANAKHFGGAFHIAPDAELTDGQLDAIAILDTPPLKRLPLFVAATRGTHVTRPGVITEQSPIFRIGFHEPPAYETDGEYHRADSVELELRCIPGALRVVVSEAAAAAYALAAKADGGAVIPALTPVPA